MWENGFGTWRSEGFNPSLLSLTGIFVLYILCNFCKTKIFHNYQNKYHHKFLCQLHVTVTLTLNLLTAKAKRESKVPN